MSSDMTSWRQEINAEMLQHGDTWDGSIVVFGRSKWNDGHENVDLTDVDACLDRMFFPNDFGAIDGLPFTLWTNDRVYFPVEYQGGVEGVSSVPRNPVAEASEHKGGN